MPVLLKRLKGHFSQMTFEISNAIQLEGVLPMSMTIRKGS